MKKMSLLNCCASVPIVVGNVVVELLGGGFMVEIPLLQVEMSSSTLCPAVTSGRVPPSQPGASPLLKGLAQPFPIGLMSPDLTFGQK